MKKHNKKRYGEKDSKEMKKNLTGILN